MYTHSPRGYTGSDQLGGFLLYVVSGVLLGRTLASLIPALPSSKLECVVVGAAITAHRWRRYQSSSLAPLSQLVVGAVITAHYTISYVFESPHCRQCSRGGQVVHHTSSLTFHECACVVCGVRGSSSHTLL